MKRKVLILLVMTFLLSSCAAQKASSPMYAPVVEAPREFAAEESMNDSYDYAEEAAGEQGAASVERLVIKNAYLSVAVIDPAKSVEEIGKLAESMQGYVVSSNVNQTTLSSGVSVPRGNITIRVPAGLLDKAMQEVKQMAADIENGIISESISGEDVTSDYVDSQSRLRNLEAAEAQLVELLDSAQDLQYVLEIFRELTRIRSEIEVLKGHLKYLEESAALSSLSVELVAEESLQPIEIGGWKPKGIAKDAIQALINTLQWFGTAAIWIGIFCLPFLIPLGIGAYFLIKGIKKAKAKKKALNKDIVA